MVGPDMRGCELVKSYQTTRTPPAPDSAVVRGPGEVEVRLRVNGETWTMSVEPRVSLLDARRDRLDLTGTIDTSRDGYCVMVPRMVG